MKKLLTIFLVLIILFSNISAMAKEILVDNTNEEVTTTIVTKDEVVPDTVTTKPVEQPEEAKEEKEQLEETKEEQPEEAKEEEGKEIQVLTETKEEIVLEKKEEVVEIVKDEKPVVSTKSAPVLRASEEPKTCTYRITFNESDTKGNPVNSGYQIAQSYANTLSLNGGWSKLSKSFTKTTFTKGGTVYQLVGWYGPDGNPVPESMYYKGSPLRIRVSVGCTMDDPDNAELVYTLRWEAQIAPKINFIYTDKVSTGSGSWANTNGATDSYTHTFITPDEPTHYQFLYWELDGKEYKNDDSYTVDFTGMSYGEEKTINAYAIWQPDVTVNLYSDKKLISSESSFESITVDTEPTKYGYKFLGWTDKDGNDVTELTFTANEKGRDPEPIEINLYAKWERIMVNIDASKVWDDNNNQDGYRTDSVKFNLMNGEEVVDSVVLSEDNDWTHTFTVPKYDTEKEIQYTVIEETVVSEYDDPKTDGNIEEGFTITNTHKPEETSVTVTKEWEDADNQDGVRPNSITVRLLADGEEVQTIILSEVNKWTSEINELPKKNSGQDIEYTIDELTVENYKTEITGSMKDGFKIINTHNTKETSITVTKVWKDNDNQDGIRPEKVTVKLLADGEEVETITLSEGNKWTETINELPKNNNGKEINYTISELEVSNYETKITGNMEDGYTITNTHTPEVTSVTISKVWEDVNDQDGVRPDMVIIHLTANGKEIKTITLSDSNEWKTEIKDLSVYENGKEIEYIVSEEEVNLYESTITGSLEDGFVVTNMYTPQGGEEVPEEEEKENNNNPQTGDTINNSIVALVLSTNLLTASLYCKKKYN